MKAKDLTAMLLQCDPETEVAFEMDSGCCGDWEDMEISYTDFNDYDPKSISLRIRFGSLPGYRSCRQSSGTKEAHKEYWKGKI